MLAESKKFFSFVKVGPTRCEDQMVGFHNAESAHPGGGVESVMSTGLDGIFEHVYLSRVFTIF